MMTLLRLLELKATPISYGKSRVTSACSLMGSYCTNWFKWPYKASHGRHWVQVDRRLCLKLAAATKGDVKQLKWFSEACKGDPQPMAPPMFLQSSQTKTSASQDHAFMANVDFIS